MPVRDTRYRFVSDDPAAVANAFPAYAARTGEVRDETERSQVVNAQLAATAPFSMEPRAAASVPPPVSVVPTRYVLLPLAALVTGYTVKAMERKIERGDWVEGKVWRRAPDGRILIDLAGYQKWVESA
jgi:hypothetical protein